MKQAPQIQIPDGTSVDDYVRMMRNQRMAAALAAQNAAPMQYNQNGFISGGQLLGNALTNINSNYYNNAADEDNAKAAIAKNEQMKQMFGVTQPNPQQLGSALTAQQSSQSSNPLNILNDPRRSMFMAQNYDKAFEEALGKNAELTNDQKNAAAGNISMADIGKAELAKRQAEGIKTVNAGDTALNFNNGQQMIAPKLLDIQAGDRHVLGNQTDKGFTQTGSVATGVSPNKAFNVQTGERWTPEELDYWTKEAQKVGNTDFAKGASKQNRDALLGNIAKLQVAGGAGAGDYTDKGQDTAGGKTLITQLDGVKSPIRPFNAAISHMAALDPLIDGLQNNDTKMLNKASNFVKNQLGQTAVPNFEAAKQIVADEVTKAVVGGQMSLDDRKGIQDTLNNANSPQQLRAVVETFKNLMAGQLGAIEQQYKATGRDPAVFRQKYLEPESQAVINRIRPLMPIAPNNGEHTSKSGNKITFTVE